MRLPGFTAELTLEKSHCVWGGTPSRGEQTVRRSVVAASGGRKPLSQKVYCRRLLRQCISGSDPRSLACDSWLIFC